MSTFQISEIKDPDKTYKEFVELRDIPFMCVFQDHNKKRHKSRPGRQLDSEGEHCLIPFQLPQQ